MKIEKIEISKLIPYENNAKLHPKEQIEQIKKSIEEFGFNDPIGIDENNMIIEGHGRYEALKELGYKEVECIRLKSLTDEQKKAYILVHNKLTMNTGFDIEILQQELEDIETIDMEQFDFDFDLDLDFKLDNEDAKENPTLVEKFGIPPFSIIDTRQGYWQDRKRAWKQIGLDSSKGRDENLMCSTMIEDMKYEVKTGNKAMAPTTSIFDPVLCEIMYKWFNVDGGKIFDFFAGGSVRGVIADKLGYDYLGIDLRQEQIDANYLNAKQIGCNPTWICDDSLNMNKYIDDNSVDMLFTCPPYADLEVYSDDPRDISTMDYDDFVEAYTKIIKNACNKLKNNRFAVIVIGDVRDKKGFYRDFITDTKKAFMNEGLKLYNELILIEQSGTGAMRASKVFGSLRKVIKTHQNVLVFYKGDDAREIKNNYGEMTFDEEFIDDMQ